VSDFKGRNIRPWRLLTQLLGVLFVLGLLIGLPNFGTFPVLRHLFLPNASCRYISSAPTSCYYYQLQDGLVHGASDLYIDLIVLLLGVVISIVLLGRFWCSWLCPFGASQELITWTRKLLRIPPLRLKWAHRVVLRRVKYTLLFLTVLFSLPLGISALGIGGCQSTLALPFCQVCPAKGFFTISQQLLGLEPMGTALPVLAIVSLLLFVLFSFILRQAFCRICPMGGLMALLGRVSLPYLRKDPDKCTKCRVCLRVCPMDHDRVYDEMDRMDVAGEDCTLCGRCVELCPEKGCLSLTYGPFDLVSSRKPRKRWWSLPFNRTKEAGK